MNKRKVLSLFLVLAMMVSLVAGCAKAEDEPEETEEEEVVDVEETDEDEEEVESTGNIAKLGLGKTISAKATDADEEETANGQIDVTAAAVGFDEEGKVVSVSIDTVQGKVAFDENLELETDVEEELLSKKELSDDYGMRPASEIEKEWDEQIEAFEEWMIGKTIDEITGLEVVEKDENHTHIPDVEELTSTVTMTVESYLEAVEAAWDNAEDVNGGETVGLGFTKSLAKSEGLEDADEPKVALDVSISAVSFDEDDIVTGSIVDTIQAAIEFDEDGKATSLDEEILSKKELSDDYGMKPVSEIEKEWDEQVEAFEEWMVGKTIDEITGLEVKERDENHKHVPDVEELTSTVTITVEGILEVVQNAFDNKK